MDDQSFVTNNDYPFDSNVGPQFESPDATAPGQWHTTSSANTMELERHLTMTSISRDVRASSVSSQASQRYDDNDRPYSTDVTSTQSEPHSNGNGGQMISDHVHDSREPTKSRTSTYDHYDSIEKPQSDSMSSILPLDPNLIDPRTSESSQHHTGTSKQQKSVDYILAGNVNQKPEGFGANSSANQNHGSSERLEPAHLMPTSELELERRGRSPSPRPKVSAETRARWALLKQLAGVSQHDVEEEAPSEQSDKETRTTELDIQVREEAGVRGSSQTDERTDERADDASIERYLQKLQGDPHIDSRGLQDGLSRMHSNKGSKRYQDQGLAYQDRSNDNMHSDARKLSDDTRINEVETAMHRGNQDMTNVIRKGERRAEQVLKDRETALGRDGHALGSRLEETGRRAQEKIQTASRDAQGHLQNDKQGFERDIRKDAGTVDVGIHMLGSQIARDFQRAGSDLEAGLQGAAHVAATVLPHTNVRQNLQRGEHDVMEDIHKAENAFGFTGLGPEVRKREHNLVEKVHKLEHEVPQFGLRQEIRKGEASLMGDIHKVGNKLADPKLGQEVQKGEQHLMNEFHKLEHELPHLGLGQDLRKGEHDLKQGLQEAEDHLRRDKQALAKGAEVAGRSVEHGLENIGNAAAEGTAIAVRLGMTALDHARSGNSASGPRQNVLQPSHSVVKPNNQQILSKSHQSGAGAPHPPEAPGVLSATDHRGPNQTPKDEQNRQPLVKPPRNPPAPQTLQPSHGQNPPSSQQPHLSPIPSLAGTAPPGPAVNKDLGGKMPSPSPSPSPGNIQRSRAPISRTGMGPRPKEPPQQRPPNAMPPQPQTQGPSGAPQHSSQPQHPQEASQPLPQPKNAPGAQSHHPQTMSQHPQPPHPVESAQHPQNTKSQRPLIQHPSRASQSSPNPTPQHAQVPYPRQGSQQSQPSKTVPPQLLSPHLSGSQQSQPPKTVPQQVLNPHLQGSQQSQPPKTVLPNPRSQGGPQQKQPTSVMPHQPQPVGSQKTLEQRRPASTKPQQRQASHSNGTPEQRSTFGMPPITQESRTHGPLLQNAQGSMTPVPQSSHRQGTSEPTMLKGGREGEAKQPEAMPHSNMQQARQAIPGATAGPRTVQVKPLSTESPNSEGKADKEEPIASIMQERRRRAADSQRRLAERQKPQNGNDKEYDAEHSPNEIGSLSATEHAEGSQSISGPQSMLNMFKARADAAIEASGECPSFTDRK